jgi:hypothetical protein
MNADVVDVLLAAGANIEARTRNGQSAQDLIEHFSKPPSVPASAELAQPVENFLSGKRDSVPEIPDVETAVIRRAEPRQITDVNAKNPYGMLPIEVAAQAGDVAEFRAIVDHPDFDPSQGRPHFFAKVGRDRDGYSNPERFAALDRELEAFDARFPLDEEKKVRVRRALEDLPQEDPVHRNTEALALEEELQGIIRKASPRSENIEASKPVSVDDEAPVKIRSADKQQANTPIAPLKTLLGGRFIGDENGNYRRPGEKTIALRDENNEIVLNDKQIETFMAGLELAKAKGWSAIEVEGSKRFRREAWLRGQQEGMEVVGYEPTSLDLDTLAQMLEKSGADQIAPGVSASLDEAKNIAITSGKGFVAPNYDNGSYAGSVLGETEHHYLVTVDGRAGTATAVEKTKLEGITVKPGEMLKVKFQSGKAQAQKDQGRSLSR